MKLGWGIVEYSHKAVLVLQKILIGFWIHLSFLVVRLTRRREGFRPKAFGADLILGFGRETCGKITILYSDL